MNKDSVAGKTVLVMGLGRFGGGVDVAKFAHSLGAKVTITDLQPADKLSASIEQLRQYPDIELHLGSHDPADFERADIIVVNPAVPPDNEMLKRAARLGKLITAQISIFFELCPAPVIGITGANGKSTTAALTAHLLKSAVGRDPFPHSAVWLSGNIGNQPLLASLPRIRPDHLVVLELSSFQLEQLAPLKKAPKVALLTNLTPNHLDRHGTFAAYCAAKENIFALQHLDPTSPAVSIFNAEDTIAAQWFEKYKGDPARISIAFTAHDVGPDIRPFFKLPGRANLSNLAAALAVARHFRVPEDRIKAALPHFEPLPHRLELVRRIGDVRWYNDSIATTPQSAIAALDAFDCPKILIAGGYDKNLPFDQLARKIARAAKAVVLIGATAGKIADALAACPENQARIEFAPSLERAVEAAAQMARPGDVVILSPACASYDMFDNFQQRGLRFAEIVRSLPP
jgi:UDP-N-acetylmuramoylalanine--D-glutamate ligase